MAPENEYPDKLDAKLAKKQRLNTPLES